METWARPSPASPPGHPSEGLQGGGAPPEPLPGPVPYFALDEGEDFDSIYVIPMELHIGAEEFDMVRFLEWREWILNTPNARVLLLGDILEFATRNSVSDVYSQTIPPEAQMLEAVSLLAPLRQQIWGLVEGNHEGRAAREVGLHPGRWLAMALQVPYFPGRQGTIKVRFGRGANGKPVAYLIAFAHGSSYARTPGGRLAAAWRLPAIVANADVYICGHSHGHVVDMGTRFVVDPHNNCVREEKFYVVLAGSFLNYGGYAREKGWAPLGVGCPRIRLDGRKKDVHVSI